MIGSQAVMEIAATLSNHTSLTALALRETAMQDITPGYRRPERMPTQLRTLDLADNNLGGLIEGTDHRNPNRMQITQYLQGCTNLQTLHLDDNGLGDRVTTHLLDHHLRTMPLTTLDLGSNSLSPNIVPALCQALSEMRAMRKLLLQHNFLGPA